MCLLLILLCVSQDSWICGLVFASNFGKILAILHSNIPLLSSLFLILLVSRLCLSHIHRSCVFCAVSVIFFALWFSLESVSRPLCDLAEMTSAVSVYSRAPEAFFISLTEFGFSRFILLLP